jgi:hypothetical protein
MWIRNILIISAAGVLSATPVLAQQKAQQPTRPATSVSQDTTKGKTRTHRRTTTARNATAATSATPASKSSASTKSDSVKKVASTGHKTRKHRTTATKPASDSKKG